MFDKVLNTIIVKPWQMNIHLKGFYAVIFFLADAWKVGDHILVKNIK